MRYCFMLFVVAVLTATPVLAGPPELAFKPAEKGYYHFNTGVVKGKLRLDGTNQGIPSMVHVPTGEELTHGGGNPGIFSYYRVFSTGTRYGKTVRDWPTESKLLSDGAVEVRWPPAEDHPLEITAIYRWHQPDTLDLETIVKPQQNMPHFELYLSTYFAKGFRASVYVKPNDDERAKPSLLPVENKPGGYVMFLRDNQAELMMSDGRWKHPPNAMSWSVKRWLAAPLVMRRDEARGLAGLLMSPPEDCFAVSTPYNRVLRDQPGYRSVYHSLFGRDIGAGQTARAHVRLVITKDLSRQRAVELYQQYLLERIQKGLEVLRNSFNKGDSHVFSFDFCKHSCRTLCLDVWCLGSCRRTGRADKGRDYRNGRPRTALDEDYQQPEGDR